MSGRGTPTLERQELPVAQPVRRRFGSRLPWALRRSWRATELGAFREGEHSREVLYRDSRFRHALATADAVAALLTFAAVVMLGGDAPAATAWLLLPLVVAVGKVAGLYDRDENLLSKSTVDELPALFQVSTVYALVVWLADGFFVAGNLGRSQVIVLWGLLFVAIASARALARRIVLRSTEGERCLVLGSLEAAELLKSKIESSSLINASISSHSRLRESGSSRQRKATMKCPAAGRSAPPRK